MGDITSILSINCNLNLNGENRMLTKAEDLKYQLESLASYAPSDLDNPEFEVGYEDDKGNEGFASICCVDVAKRALERINELETQVKGVKIETLINLRDAIQPDGLVNSDAGVKTIRSITNAINGIINKDK